MKINLVSGVDKRRQYIVNDKTVKKAENNNDQSMDLEEEIETDINDIKEIRDRTDEIVTKNLMCAYSAAGTIKRLSKIKKEVIEVQGANSEREEVINKMIDKVTDSYNESMGIVKKLTDEYKSNFSNNDTLEYEEKIPFSDIDKKNKLQDEDKKINQEVSFNDIKTKNEISLRNDSAIKNKEVSFRDIR